VTPVEFKTMRYMLQDVAEPETGLRVTDRRTMRQALLDRQSADDLLAQAARLATYRLTGASAERALDWLVESYL
jgi:hypothetical protein